MSKQVFTWTEKKDFLSLFREKYLLVNKNGLLVNLKRVKKESHYSKPSLSEDESDTWKEEMMELDEECDPQLSDVHRLDGVVSDDDLELTDEERMYILNQIGSGCVKL